MSLAGKVIIVTGGAGAIGQAITRRLLLVGAQVVWTDFDSEAMSRVDAIVADGAQFFHHDVSSPEDWAALEALVMSKFGRLDGLVNNAGIYRKETIAEVTIDSFRDVMRVNVEGALLGCQYALRLMGDVGSIVNIASIAAFRPGSQSVSYGASKAALLNVTQAVARYAIDQKRKIRCNAICPGAVDTAMSSKVLAGADPDIVAKIYKNSTVQGRLAKAAEIASMAVFLLSADSEFTTGAPFVVDGGLML